MGKIRSDHLQKIRKQNYGTRNCDIGKNRLFIVVLLIGLLLVTSPMNTQATIWQANSVETIKAKLKAGQNTYTFETGDTFYNIGLAVNVKWQTLMALNGFEEGSQYSVPVGTTIKFDGSRITVIDPSGHTITDKELTDQDKIDPSKPFAQQQSESSQSAGSTKTATKVEEQAAVPVDPSQAKKEKQAAEAQREQAEKEKQAAEKERQEAERLKQAAEQKLTEELNKENQDAHTELQVQQAAATAKVAEAQKNYDGLTGQLAGVGQKLVAATAAKQAAQTALTNAQTAINEATANQGIAQQRVTAVSEQIAALQAQAGEDETLQAQLTQLKQQLAAAQGELAAYGAQLTTAQQNLNTAQAAYTAAEAALNSAAAEKTSIEAAVAQAQATLNTAQQELANLPNSSSAATSEAAKKIQAELAQYQQKIAALDQQITELAAKVQALDERISELEKVIQGASEEVQQAETKGKEAEDSAEDTEDHLGKSDQTAKEVEDNLPHVPTNEDKYVTIMLDEAGNLLTDTTGYVKVSESEPVKTVETLENGDTITTYTTTITYRKIVNTDKHVTIHVDEAGNPLTNLEGYFKLNESEPVKTVETLANGDTITTYTTTITYHKIANIEKQVTINVDEAGNPLTSLEGYFKLSESEPVKTVETLANGDTVTTYTITVTYHKIQNKDKYVTKHVDEAGNELTDLTGYRKISESEPIKTVETLANGDTITTYTTTITYKKIDPIIEAIKPANDPAVQTIKDQVVKDDTRVTVDQADNLVNVAFSKEVAKHFEQLVQEEQEKYGEKKVSNTKDEAAYREVAERAVEVMYNFSHTRPANTVSGETYVVDREIGSEKMGFWTENISHTYIRKVEVEDDSTILAQLIAKQMFLQYIEYEREAGRAGDYTNGGHYINIIQSGFSDMALAVFIVVDEEYPDTYYKVSTAVCTGPVSIVK
ncbi:LysM peptidoglycan-binding domain-containing protein [Enterococcus sp. DIV0756]|uniref:cell envelope integrity protein TolA n=1 Tax=Enterococcus sp. DIV0756 TaxID=2774636 RepID=UPI003F2541F3